MFFQSRSAPDGAPLLQQIFGINHGGPGLDARHSYEGKNAQMKKSILFAAAAALLTAPAFAASMTVSFANDDGTIQVWTLDDTGKATAGDGTVVDYTYDDEGKVLCAAIPDAGDVCATFDTAGENVGDTSTYTLSSGGTGTATITAVTE